MTRTKSLAEVKLPAPVKSPVKSADAYIHQSANGVPRRDGRPRSEIAVDIQRRRLGSEQVAEQPPTGVDRGSKCHPTQSIKPAVHKGAAIHRKVASADRERGNGRPHAQPIDSDRQANEHEASVALVSQRSCSRPHLVTPGNRFHFVTAPQVRSWYDAHLCTSVTTRVPQKPMITSSFPMRVKLRRLAVGQRPSCSSRVRAVKIEARVQQSFATDASSGGDPSVAGPVERLDLDAQ